MVKTSLIPETEVRFKFGKNWQAFLRTLNEIKIKEAEQSLLQDLKRDNLNGLRFLDIGCGSGLFSLAARRLGAIVHSFDYDLQSVECAQFLKEKYFSQDKNWKIEQGSILDPLYLKKLGQFDIIYSWGVLHHTGNMNQAFENISQLLKSKGLLFISIYNDQGIQSKIWAAIKKIYNQAPFYLKPLIFWPCAMWLWKCRILWGTFRYANPFKFLLNYHQGNRGMSIYYDALDWVGGYPFEVAKPEQVFNFFHSKKYSLIFLKTCGGKMGCNEFVFQVL